MSEAVLQLPSSQPCSMPGQLHHLQETSSLCPTLHSFSPPISSALAEPASIDDIRALTTRVGPIDLIRLSRASSLEVATDHCSTISLLRAHDVEMMGLHLLELSSTAVVLLQLHSAIC